ncbi:MAG: DUF2512 family protein [Limnochordia bacterium]|jgi:hypothetical protein
MKHLRALAIKFIMISIVTMIFVPLFGSATLGGRISLALAVTIIAYVAGDLFILPQYGNTTATIADGFLAALVYYLGQSMMPNASISLFGVIVLGIIVALGEFYFHRYVQETVV